MATHYAEVDLIRLVRRAAGHFDGLAAERGIALVVEAPECVPAELDPEKLERMFLNLLSNAFKFAPSGGTVRCFVAADSERATVHVLDSGPGVRPELREAIFERFRQGEEGAGRRFGGTGLGLSIVKHLAEGMGAVVTVESHPGRGTTFTVRLPPGQERRPG